MEAYTESLKTISRASGGHEHEATAHAGQTESEIKTVAGDGHVIAFMVPIFVIISVVAILGNILVVFLFVRNLSWLKKAHGNLILALAITDIMTAICVLTVPLFIHENDVFPVPENTIARELYCRVVWSHYLVFSLAVSSVYICLSLAIERWLAVRRPLFYKQHLHSKRNITWMVLLPWLAGFAFESSALIRTSGVILADGTVGCTWNRNTSEWSARVTIAIVSFLGMIMLPGVLVVAAYVHILIKVNTTLKRNPQRQRDSSLVNKSEFKRVTLMAAVASITLIICWLPGQFYFMLSQMDYVKVHVIEHRWLNVLAFSSICFNPFIYAFWNPKYREGFKSELAALLCWISGARTSYCVNAATPSEGNSHCAGTAWRRAEEGSPSVTGV